MEEKYERLMKNKGSMTDVRNVAKQNTDFREQFKKSMEPVLNQLVERFECMKLKDVPFSCDSGLNGVR